MSLVQFRLWAFCFDKAQKSLYRLQAKGLFNPYGILAQSVEHMTFNHGVPGSNPGCLITHYADVAELADAPDLGSGERSWGFESLHPQYQRLQTLIE